MFKYILIIYSDQIKRCVSLNGYTTLTGYFDDKINKVWIINRDGNRSIYNVGIQSRHVKILNEQITSLVLSLDSLEFTV